MSHVIPFGVGFQQWANQQHRCAGRADKIGQQTSHSNDPGIELRRSHEMPLNRNPAADDIQAEQQSDKGNVLDEYCVFENGHRVFGSF